MVKQLNVLFDKRIYLLCPDNAEQILTNLENIAMCALFLEGEDQMCLKDMVELELGLNINEFDPDEFYWESFDDLIDEIGGCNYISSKLDGPMIKIMLDEEKMKLINNNSEYNIYKLVIR